MQLQPDVKKIHDLRDSACCAAGVLAERIHLDPNKTDYQTTYDAANFAFRLLSMMKERGATLLGAEARVRLRQSLGRLQKTKKAHPYFCDFGSELDKAIQHIDEFLHAITMFRPQRPNGGAKTPAQPTESGEQQDNAADLLGPAKPPVEEHTNAETSAERSPANQKSSTDDALLDDLVTLAQVAPLTGRSKRTLEGYQLPEPDERGGGGRSHKWYYKRLRSALEKHSKRLLPKTFPASHFRSSSET